MRRRKIWQKALAQRQRHITTLGHLDGIGQRLRHIGKTFGHVGPRLEILLLGKHARTTFIRQRVTCRNTDPRVMCPEIIAVDKLHRMRRHQGDIHIQRQ